MESTDIKTAEIWKLYSKTGDPALREKLILQYSHLVKYVAGRLSLYFGTNVEYDDLVGYGALGLIDAIDKFDINKGVKFETYASLRIRGAVIDNIRALDWVPRSVRQKHKDIEKAYADLEIELGRPAKDIEVAKRVGISLNELYKTLNDISLSSLSSLEEFLEQKYETEFDVPDYTTDRPDNIIEATELREILADAINKLPDKERKVLTLYYYEDLTIKEISAIMKVSESRISQLHTKAILRLRGKLERYRLST